MNTFAWWFHSSPGIPGRNFSAPSPVLVAVSSAVLVTASTMSGMASSSSPALAGFDPPSPGVL